MGWSNVSTLFALSVNTLHATGYLNYKKECSKFVMVSGGTVVNFPLKIQKKGLTSYESTLQEISANVGGS